MLVRHEALQAALAPPARCAEIQRGQARALSHGRALFPRAASGCGVRRNHANSVVDRMAKTRPQPERVAREKACRAGVGNTGARRARRGRRARRARRGLRAAVIRGRPRGGPPLRARERRSGRAAPPPRQPRGLGFAAVLAVVLAAPVVAGVHAEDLRRRSSPSRRRLQHFSCVFFPCPDSVGYNFSTSPVL